LILITATPVSRSNSSIPPHCSTPAPRTTGSNTVPVPVHTFVGTSTGTDKGYWLNAGSKWTKAPALAIKDNQTNNQSPAAQPCILNHFVHSTLAANPCAPNAASSSSRHALPSLARIRLGVVPIHVLQDGASGGDHSHLAVVGRRLEGRPRRNMLLGPGLHFVDERRSWCRQK